MLETIQKKVQQLVSNKQKEIILAALTQYTKVHNGVYPKNICSCDYCKLLRKYIQKKKEFHKTSQYIDRNWADMYDDEVYNLDRKLDVLEQEINTLKFTKDNLKRTNHEKTINLLAEFCLQPITDQL